MSLAPVINSQSYAYDFANGTDTMLKADTASAVHLRRHRPAAVARHEDVRLPPGVRGTTVTVVGERTIVPSTAGSPTTSRRSTRTTSTRSPCRETRAPLGL